MQNGVDNSTWGSLSESIVRIFAIPVITTAIFLLVVLMPLDCFIPDPKYRLFGRIVIFFILIFVVDRLISTFVNRPVENAVANRYDRDIYANRVVI